MHVLVVDSDRWRAARIGRALRRIRNDVTLAADVQAISAILASGGFKTIVVDASVAGSQAAQFFAALQRSASAARIISLGKPPSMRGALEVEWLRKPVVLREVVRRVGGPAGSDAGAPHLVVAGDLQIDLAGRYMMTGERRMSIGPRECDVIAALIRHSNRWMSRFELSAQVWGREAEYDSRMVQMTILRLRRRLKDLGSAVVIKSHWGDGYTLVPTPTITPPSLPARETQRAA